MPTHATVSGGECVGDFSCSCKPGMKLQFSSGCRQHVGGDSERVRVHLANNASCVSWSFPTSQLDTISLPTHLDSSPRQCRVNNSVKSCERKPLSVSLLVLHKLDFCIQNSEFSNVWKLFTHQRDVWFSHAVMSFNCVTECGLDHTSHLLPFPLSSS